MEGTQTEVAVTPEAPVAAPAETASHVAAPVEGAATPPAAYTPNYKFKVRDEEKEFDEWVKPILKDSDTETKIRDLYTKAHGLEPLKQRLSQEVEEYKTKYQTLDGDYSGLSQQLSKLSFHVNNKDFDSFFEGLNIPKTAIYEWVNRKIEEQGMSPEQKSAVEHQRQMQHRLYELEQQNKSFTSQFENVTTQGLVSQFESELARPDVQTIAKAFEEKVGQPGSFRTEAIKRGIALTAQLKRDATPQEVITEMMATYGKILSQPSPAAMGGASSGNPPVVPAKPPTIPNIGSRGGSPVRQVPKSIADLKQRAAEL